MQRAKISRFILPCGRRVHLYKSVSFKLIVEQILANHTNYAKSDPKTIEESMKKQIKT